MFKNLNPKPDHEVSGYYSYREIFEAYANFCTVCIPQVQQKSPDFIWYKAPTVPIVALIWEERLCLDWRNRLKINYTFEQEKSIVSGFERKLKILFGLRIKSMVKKLNIQAMKNKSCYSWLE